MVKEPGSFRQLKNLFIFTFSFLEAFLLFYLLFCIWAFCLCMSVPQYMPGAQGGLQGLSVGSTGLQLQIVAGHHVGAGRRPGPSARATMFLTAYPSLPKGGVFFLIFLDRVSPCSPGALRTHSVDQDAPTPERSICLPGAGFEGVCHHCLAKGFLICC